MINDDVQVFYSNHPDPDRAGQGLTNAPLAASVLGKVELCSWLMSPAEQMAMIYLLEHSRPEIAIEIGTRFGGSLQVVSKYAKKVYSLDIDPTVPERMAGRFENVEYIIGPSQETLPRLLEKLKAEGKTPGFCLVDGDHSVEGVRADIDSLLVVKPLVPMFIVMHDSFNPDCRRGLQAANWAGNEYVHAAELDFVAGVVNPAPATRGQLWGGLALGYLKPEKRTGHFEVTGRAELTFEAAVAMTDPKSPLKNPRTALRRMWRVATGNPLMK